MSGDEPGRGRQPGAAVFADSTSVRSLGDGTFVADLHAEWAIGTHPHGGFLMALLARTAAARAAEHGEPPAEPLVVSTDFLRPPALGPVLLRTEVRKLGRQVSVLAVRLEQRGRGCVDATVTLGRPPVRQASWSDLPEMAVSPPSGSISLSGQTSEGVFNLSQGCDVRVDPATAGYLSGRTGDPPRMRLWVRPRHAEPDTYFALLAGDINPPVVFNKLGVSGWAPSVQLTAQLRARPAAGWLRVHVECKAIHGGWFDSDATVVDANGKLICQARQLALAPAR